MKKLIFTATLLLAILSGHAQLMDLGVAAGLNASKIGGEDSGGENTYRLAPMGGLTLMAELNDRLDFRGELSLLSGKGGINALGEAWQVNTVFNYMDLGAMLCFTVTQEPVFYVYGGPVLGYLLTAENHYKFNDSQENIEPWIKDADLLLAGGAEVALIEKLYLGCRFQGGLAKLPKDNANKSYNRVVQLYFRYDIKRFY